MPFHIDKSAKIEEEYIIKITKISPLLKPQKKNRNLFFNTFVFLNATPSRYSERIHCHIMLHSSNIRLRVLVHGAQQNDSTLSRVVLVE